MMEENSAGFAEIEHTADWALKVWAPDLPSLFSQSARGMYWLMETTLQEEPILERTIDLEGFDLESLLVGFLSELLYYGESERIGFDRFAVGLENSRLHAACRGAFIAGQKKEIKAVTFHNLRIEQSLQGYGVTIVFDV